MIHYPGLPLFRRASSQLIQVKCRKHGLLLIFAPCLRMATGHLSDRQHAFRKWHSCETQLTTVINDWAKILDILKRLLILLPMSLKANCLAME